MIKLICERFASHSNFQKGKINMNKTLTALCALAATAIASAQVGYVSGTYTQNFDTLASFGIETRPNSSTTTTPVSGQVWNNNSTLQGWYSSFENNTNVGLVAPVGTNGNWIGAGILNSPTPHTIPTLDTRFIRISDGSGATQTGATFNYGTANASDRALGILNSGSVASTAPARNTMGIRFKNNSGRTLTEFTVRYTGEQWRRGAGTGTPVAPDRIDFAYRIFGAGTFNVDQMPVTVTSGWNDVNALDFVAPQTGTTALALDGNLAANQTALSSTITGLNWAVGDDIVLRWTDFDRPGADDGLAVDNFSFQAVPEPGSALVLALGFAALAKRRKK